MRDDGDDETIPLAAGANVHGCSADEGGSAGEFTSTWRTEPPSASAQGYTRDVAARLRYAIYDKHPRHSEFRAPEGTILVF